MPGPRRWLMTHECCFRCAMETLYHTIGRRMICCGVLYLNTTELEQSSKKAGFKLSTLVCCDALGTAKTCYLCRKKSFCNRLSCDIHYWYGFRPTCEPIYHSQTVSMTIRGWQRSNEVQMDVEETAGRLFEITNRCLNMAGHLTLLTGGTSS
jgi:hypothetical protein